MDVSCFDLACRSAHRLIHISFSSHTGLWAVLLDASCLVSSPPTFQQIQDQAWDDWVAAPEDLDVLEYIDLFLDQPEDSKYPVVLGFQDVVPTTDKAGIYPRFDFSKYLGVPGSVFVSRPDVRYSENPLNVDLLHAVEVQSSPSTAGLSWYRVDTREGVTPSWAVCDPY